MERIKEIRDVEVGEESMLFFIYWKVLFWECGKIKIHNTLKRNLEDLDALLCS